MTGGVDVSIYKLESQRQAAAVRLVLVPGGLASSFAAPSPSPLPCNSPANLLLYLCFSREYMFWALLLRFPLVCPTPLVPGGLVTAVDNTPPPTTPSDPRLLATLLRQTGLKWTRIATEPMTLIVMTTMAATMIMIASRSMQG